MFKFLLAFGELLTIIAIFGSAYAILLIGHGLGY